MQDLPPADTAPQRTTLIIDGESPEPSPSIKNSPEYNPREQLTK